MKELERELKRKDEALAETAALLVLHVGTGTTGFESHPIKSQPIAHWRWNAVAPHATMARIRPGRLGEHMKTDVRFREGWLVAVPLGGALLACVLLACNDNDRTVLHTGGEGTTAVGTGGSSDGLDAGSAAAGRPSCEGAGSNVDLNCAAPPDTFASPVPEAEGEVDAGLARSWDLWAWNSFVAYNWPALSSDDVGRYPSGFVRGVPDTTQSFARADPSDVLVWETFKEKREVFNVRSTAGAWQDLTYESQYAPDFLEGQVPPCPQIETARLERVKRRPRVVAQLGKQVPPSSFDELDETAEVASPAQESQATLCAGYSGDAGAACRSAYPAPPPGRDAGAEYSATQANSRAPVGPRVFRGRPAKENFVYYEVKVNWDYYNYVATNGYAEYGKATRAARREGRTEIRLPSRTSAPRLAQESRQNGLPICGYRAALTHRCYSDQLNDCAQVEICPTVADDRDAGTHYEPVPSKPPGVGSVQLKAAWLPSRLVPEAERDDYHRTEAVFYREAPSAPEGLCYSVEEFVLIGLHVIQRVHAGAASAHRAETVGGTFIFATWEHESIGDGSGYSYVNYPYSQGVDQQSNRPYPNTNTGIAVRRVQDYPLPSTARVTAEVHRQLPSDSVWRHYRLIGTQFLPTNSEAESLRIHQPYYLANLVIETNLGLQQFQGLPPNVNPVANYAMQIGNTVDAGFEPMDENVQFGSVGHSMGGCMGCHGVAQANGFAFSFVLQDGSQGTRPDTAESIAIPPVPPPQ